VANVIIVVKVALSFRIVLNVLKILSEKILHPVYVKLGIMKIYKAIKLFVINVILGVILALNSPFVKYVL
jgi:hypothetical protein